MLKKYNLVFILSFLVVSKGFSQTGTASPYSRFGLGDLANKELSANKAMGGAGIGFSEGGYINLLNPASYASLRYTVFEAGLTTSWTKEESLTGSQWVSNTNLNFLSLAFPVGKKWGSSISLLPFSSTSYRVANSENVDSVGTVAHTFKGTGGINQVVIGNAYSINKNFQVGLNISYLFGSIHKERTVEFQNYTNPFNTRVSNDLALNGFIFDMGLQFKKELKEGRFLNVGVVAGIGSSLSGTNSETLERFQYRDAGGFIIPIDSVPSRDDQKEKIKLPATYGGGIAYGNKKWKFAADYKTQNWSGFGAFGQSDGLSNSQQVSVGVQYVPNIDAIKNYFKLIHYRAGFKMSNSQIQINGTQLKENAVTLGGGFPIRRSMSVLNVAIEGGQFGTVGTVANPLIKESFVRVHFSITFNDRWFIKRQVD